MIAKTKHIRHFGANALELCYVANGLTDAFVDIRGKLRTTDVAAGFLILKEAGGIVTTPDNQVLNVELDPKQTVSFIASGNMQIHEKILSLVKISMLNLLWPNPAALIKSEKTKTLLIADPHLGWEMSLQEKGIHVPSQTPKILNKLTAIITKYKPQATRYSWGRKVHCCFQRTGRVA